ncbi:MAG: AAA family ATPase [Polyangiaceae bacterium]|nr:AAA family ATPase [Polyangiaceae bacterium]
MKIPYAKCDFAAIRRSGSFYVDKTPFFPHLENAGGEHLIFLRPRRFGKSTLISTLENYYDIALADKFDELFGGLWVHEHPTPEKNKYLVLRFDFSPVASEGTEADIRKSFAVQVKASIRSFIWRYEKLLPRLATLEATVRSDEEDTAALMTELFTVVRDAEHQVYLLIDEYDHFGNRLLSDGLIDTYQGIVRSSGFVRSFYANLKAFTITSTLARMFVTGVSPIMLDDLSSGFNIITHVSQHDALNALAGFTTADVERAVDLMLRDRPDLAADPRIGDRKALLETLERYYDGYRFSVYAQDKMYNSTLVLYFVGQVLATGRYPRQMLDLNVRTDYGRLYGIARNTSGQETGTRELLEEILTNESVTSPLVEQFGTRMLFGRAQIVSLFYYMGMLTFSADAMTSSDPKLVIPNRVMRELQWSYIAFAMADHEGLQIDLTDVSSALRKMSVDGEIQPLLDLFHKQVLGRISNRDLIQFDEKTMKLMLFAYLSQTNSFYLMSEKEVTQGYCDLLLALRGNASAAKYAWIIEAKYVKTDATDKDIEAAVAKGFAQIERYAADADLVKMLTLGNHLRAGVLVFVGTKDVRYWAWETAASSALRS